MAKLLNTNVSTRFVQAVKAMYSSVKSSVKYKSKLSECIFSNVGVKQGDPSSSLLCLFFLNDILDNIDTSIPSLLDIDDLKIFLLLFANDAVLFAENPLSLHLLLNDVEKYCKA